MVHRVVLALFVILFATVSFGQVADDPAARRDHLLKHRWEEAARKERSARNLIAASEKATGNQNQYDVTHYDLVLDLDPTSEILTGTVTTTALVTGAAIGSLDLDLDAVMTVSGATSAGIAAATTRVEDLITVTLDRTYSTGETVVIAVSYSGNPALASGAFGATFGWDTYGGEPMIWTLSEPYGARSWWPCKDLNTDKADSVDITVTVPRNLIVGSNGLLMSDVTDGDLRTFHWQSHYPIATYLVSLAVHPYFMYSDWYTPLGGGDPMEVQNFIFPDHVGTVEPIYALTVPMIDAFASVYGEYPFVNEKYGHAEFVWGGGMEHQTLTSLGGASMDLISHELAHQWWGDMVTCADFGHIWLNEGFATWSEAYWAETYQGFTTYQEYMQLASYFGGGTIFVEDPLTEQIFDYYLSYNKGSWIVHMLRGVLGDEDFFAGLALYRADHLYGTATTENLRDVFETVSGRDLDAFFQQWIYGEYFPIYRSSWEPGAVPGQIVVTLEQVQTNTGLFTMPVTLRITTDQGVFDVKVENSLAVEQYVLDVAGTAQSIQVDPDHWILRMIEPQAVTTASLDKGILLVNGVTWQFGQWIVSVYADSLCTGQQPFTFWDCFAMPDEGYDASLPTPLGHGPVPTEIIGDYSTVVWVGANYAGDLQYWQETPVISYLEAGGNLLLLCHMGDAYLDGELENYLGVDFQTNPVDLAECAAVATGLIDIPFIANQVYCEVFKSKVDTETEILFVDSVSGATNGVGALRTPATGGTFRADGAKFALLGGRPYFYDQTALRHNTDYILETIFDEPYVNLSPVQDPPSHDGAAWLGRNYPNPFNPRTSFSFSLDKSERVTLTVFDVSGRKVRTILDSILPAGLYENKFSWEGMDDRGAPVNSGTYFYLMTTDSGFIKSGKMMLVK